MNWDYLALRRGSSRDRREHVQKVLIPRRSGTILPTCSGNIESDFDLSLAGHLFLQAAQAERLGGLSRGDSPFAIVGLDRGGRVSERLEI